MGELLEGDEGLRRKRAVDTPTRGCFLKAEVLRVV